GALQRGEGAVDARLRRAQRGREIVEAHAARMLRHGLERAQDAIDAVRAGGGRTTAGWARSAATADSEHGSDYWNVVDRARPSLPADRPATAGIAAGRTSALRLATQTAPAQAEGRSRAWTDGHGWCSRSGRRRSSGRA